MNRFTFCQYFFLHLSENGVFFYYVFNGCNDQNGTYF